MAMNDVKPGYKQTEVGMIPEDWGCLEYIVVHELVHLRERHHNHRFTASMDRLMPHWRAYRKQLNDLPV